MITVEINPTELCNRTCSFCPRGDWYPNKSEHLTINDAHLIKNRLDEFGFQGSIIISGKGEPLLNPDILEIVNVFKNEWIELISNGDKILESPSMLDELFNNGLSRIILDEYDNEENYNKKIGEYYIETLFEYQKQFNKDKLALFMQVGSFFEIYGF